jgi:serine protease Do
MFARAICLVLLAEGLLAPVARAETIQLKDNASLSGRVLATKKDALVVDLGFTVLTVPRSAIARVTADEAPVAARPRSDKESNRSRPPREGERASDGAKTSASTRPGTGAGTNEESLFQAARTTGADRSVRDLVSQLGEAVVQVRTPGGLGSGFFLNDEGYLITNFHVIEGETQIGIEVYHQQEGPLERKVYKQVRIIAMNKFQDLALLKVDDKDAPKFAFVALGESDQLAVGERVFAIGSPLGLERTVTEGIVSTKTRQFQGELYLQTTAQINPGNSGGPLFNLRGEVTGVTNMKVFGEGIGFAIPVENVKYFLKHRDAFAYDNDNPSNPYRYLEPPSRLNHAGANRP